MTFRSGREGGCGGGGGGRGAGTDAGAGEVEEGGGGSFHDVHNSVVLER